MIITGYGANDQPSAQQGQCVCPEQPAYPTFWQDVIAAAVQGVATAVAVYFVMRFVERR
jgi:hypothetical protein